MSIKKTYASHYLKHKKYHTVTKKTIEQIRTSYFQRTFYTDNELLIHIRDWSAPQSWSTVSNTNKYLRFM